MDKSSSVNLSQTFYALDFFSCAVGLFYGFWVVKVWESAGGRRMIKRLGDFYDSLGFGTRMLVAASRASGLSMDVLYRSAAIRRAVSFLDR